MSEKHMRRLLHERLRPLDARPVENPVDPGTPDVNYMEGWVELKWVKEWPRIEVPVLMHHFTPQQRLWLRRRWEAGGHAYLLLQVAQTWLLFDGLFACEKVGFVTEKELRAGALRVWKKSPTTEELTACLTARPRLKSRL